MLGDIFCIQGTHHFCLCRACKCLLSLHTLYTVHASHPYGRMNTVATPGRISIWQDRPIHPTATPTSVLGGRSWAETEELDSPNSSRQDMFSCPSCKLSRRHPCIKGTHHFCLCRACRCLLSVHTLYTVHASHPYGRMNTVATPGRMSIWQDRPIHPRAPVNTARHAISVLKARHGTKRPAGWSWGWQSGEAAARAHHKGKDGY